MNQLFGSFISNGSFKNFKVTKILDTVPPKYVQENLTKQSMKLEASVKNVNKRRNDLHARENEQ